jgi:hypothetical protein
VAANDKAENRAHPGSIPWPEPRPLPWPGGGQRARWSADWWRAQFGSPARIRELAAQELTTGRLLPWFAVACGAGVVLYFTAERAGAVGGSGTGRGLRARRGATASADRAARDRDRSLRHRFGLCRPASGNALSGFRCDGRRFCRTARGEPAHRSFRAARRPHRRWPHRGSAAAATTLSLSQRDRKASTGRGRQLPRRANRLLLPPENPARPRSAVACAMRRRAKRTLKLINKSGYVAWIERKFDPGATFLPDIAVQYPGYNFFNTAGTSRPACLGCARGWGEGCEPRRPYWPARARSRRRGAGSA